MVATAIPQFTAVPAAEMPKAKQYGPALSKAELALRDAYDEFVVGIGKDQAGVVQVVEGSSLRSTMARVRAAIKRTGAQLDKMRTADGAVFVTLK